MNLINNGTYLLRPTSSRDSFSPSSEYSTELTHPHHENHSLCRAFALLLLLLGAIDSVLILINPDNVATAIRNGRGRRADVDTNLDHRLLSWAPGLRVFLDALGCGVLVHSLERKVVRAALRYLLVVTDNGESRGTGSLLAHCRGGTERGSARRRRRRYEWNTEVVVDAGGGFGEVRSSQGTNLDFFVRIRLCVSHTALALRWVGRCWWIAEVGTDVI